MMKILINSMAIFAIFSLSQYVHAQESKEVDPNTDLICDSINNIVSALVDAYCSVPGLESLEKKCDVYSTHGASCDLQKERDAKYVINLGYEVPNDLKLNTDQNTSTHSNNDQNQTTRLLAEEKANKHKSEDNNLFSISCINSLSNQWHCTYLNYGIKNKHLSSESQFRISKLRAELLERSEKLVSAF